MKKDSSLQRYIAEVRSVWGNGKDPDLPFKVKALMEKFLISTSPQEPWIAKLIRDSLPAKEPYRDKQHGFVQMGHVHQKGHTNSPHDHGPCWALYGLYHGAVEFTTYRRTDDGKKAGRAKLEKKELHRLTPGSVIPCLPGEIHATSTVEHSVGFRFLSCDLSKVQRYRYDEGKGTFSLA